MTSRVTARSKTFCLYGVDEPNAPMTMEAGMGFEAVRNWWGRSLCVCELLAMAGGIDWSSYQRDLALATVLDAEYERLLQSRCRIGQSKERLVRTLCLGTIDGRQVKLQRVGCAQSDALRKRGCRAEPASCQSSCSGA